MSITENSKLKRLTAHLIDAEYQGRKLAKPAQFYAWIEGGRIVPASKKINGTGLLAARFYYSGVISINPCSAPAELIAAYVSFWLQENTDKDDSSEVEFSVDPNDDKSFEIELTIETFSEDIRLVETLDGPFELGGKKYDFGEQSLWIAESFTLSSEVKGKVPSEVDNS
jgi:hypothetical protein